MPLNQTKSTFNQIDLHFGPKSDNYRLIIDILMRNSEKSIYSKVFDKWSLFFKGNYGDRLTEQLFIKQTYYSMILRFILWSKLNSLNLHLKDFERFLNPEGLIFEWIDITNFELQEILKCPKKYEFKEEDLFNNFYQEIFSPNTRHLSGEFYTYPILAAKMVKDVYKFGDKTLDPSCGSGIFIVEVLKYILNSNEGYDQKYEAIQKVYAYDINPLATLTCKINCLLVLLNHINREHLVNIDLNVFLVDSLFPKNVLIEQMPTFDLIIGNPPWLTYKDLKIKTYQKKIRELSDKLNIKPSSQYITHIELAALFFYAIPTHFAKKEGKVFFVLTKSILNGDHCFNFRSFRIFKDLEIWDFPNNYFFNVNHICLKATFIGENETPVREKYPIKTKLFDESIELEEETLYDSIEIKKNGARIILSREEAKKIQKTDESYYKKLFWQGATLVPRSLIFFEIDSKSQNLLTILPDDDVLSRSKKNWRLPFEKTQIEEEFSFITFLNKDLIPFCVKNFRNVFLPINHHYEFDLKHLEKNPHGLSFYNTQNQKYKKHKKNTSSIKSLFENLNYWNKLSKQFKNKNFIVVYNASGSRLKSAVIENSEKKIIIGSENYYYSTSLQYEAYYLSSVFNSPLLSKHVKLIKSSRHIHKRPFSLSIPKYDDDNPVHRNLGTKGKKYHTVVRDLVLNNPNISADKVRLFIHQKLVKLDSLVNQILFD